MTAEPTGVSLAAGELASALETALQQIEQMKGMFDDADGTIAQAVEDGEKALELYFELNRPETSAEAHEQSEGENIIQQENNSP